MSKSGRHWAQINEAGFIGGMRFLFGIHRWFGRWPFRLLLYPVIAWYVATRPLARRASADFLRRVRVLNPASTSDTSAGWTVNGLPGIAGVLQHFASFGESILDKMAVWSGTFDLDSVQHRGGDYLKQCIENGHGGLLICTHLGNLELCRVMSQQRINMRLTVLVHTKHAQVFNRLLAQLSAHSTLNLLQVTEMSPATAIDLAARVARGEFVVIAGDRIPVSPQPRVSFAPFMGQPAPFPVGPYVLASVLQCPVMLMFSERTRHGAVLHFEPFRDRIVLPRKAREAAFSELTAAYAARLEAHALRTPLQWFNFYDFWELPPQ